MNKLIFFSIFLLIVTFNSCAQSKQLIKNIDQLISEKYSSFAPGCSVLISKGDQVIYRKSFGSANLELKVAMQPEMIYRIGSMTKQFTAIALLQLVEKGKISLQDKIQKFIKNAPEKWKNITVENLLTHTSGIVGYEVLDFHIPNAIRIDFPPKQYIDSIAKLSTEFSPGTKFNYSNTNYLILGQIIEQITGKSYKEYLQENIFKPAGLTHTYYDSPTEIIPNRVSGYAKDNSKYRNCDYISMSQVYSAGALVSNVDDLLKWHQALYSYKLIKKETLEKAISPYQLADGKFTDYGYGWFIKDWNGSKLITHGGAIDGFRTVEGFFPEQNIFITLLFNSDSDDYFSVFAGISDFVVAKSESVNNKDLKVSDTVLDSYIGTYPFIDYPKESVIISKKGNKLVADLSNGSGRNMAMLAQSESLFYLPDIKKIATTIEFIKEDGKVTGLYWTQDKKLKCSKDQ